MSVEEIAKGLVSLCKEGKFEEPVNLYYSDDIVSVEPVGPDPVSKGKEALKAKYQWWQGNMEVHSSEVYGPFINGDRFAVGFSLDVTNKLEGKRMQMGEVGVYTVKDDKIVEEYFFYQTP